MAESRSRCKEIRPPDGRSEEAWCVSGSGENGPRVVARKRGAAVAVDDGTCESSVQGFSHLMGSGRRSPEIRSRSHAELSQAVYPRARAGNRTDVPLYRTKEELVSGFELVAQAYVTRPSRWTGRLVSQSG